MHFSMKSLFVALLAIVAGSIFLMSRGTLPTAGMAAAPATPAADSVAAGATGDRPADSKDAVAIPAASSTRTENAAPADANVAAGDIRVPAFSSDSERTETLAARQQSLPVFLKVADKSIADTVRELESARVSGATADEIAAMEEKLHTMQRVREEVLARNNDIHL